LVERSVARLARDLFFEPPRKKDALRALLDRTPSYFSAAAKTRNELAARLASAERLCAQYAVVVEHAGASRVPSRDSSLRRLTDELNNRRAYADGLRRLTEACDGGIETVSALNASLRNEVEATETALDNARRPDSANLARSRRVRFSETDARRHGRSGDGEGFETTVGTGSSRQIVTSGIPAAVAFPALDAMGALHRAITEEIEALMDIRAMAIALQRHAKPFVGTLTNGMLHGATEAFRRAEARGVPMAPPVFEHDRHTPDRVYDDDLCRAMAINKSAEIVPGASVAFEGFALNGYDAHAVVKRGGLLRRARRGSTGAALVTLGDVRSGFEKDPSAVAMTAVIYEGKAYGFADEDGALQFASQPDAYLKKLARICATRPELLRAMDLEDVVSISKIIAETVAELRSSGVALESDSRPIAVRDFGAQTPTHFVERRVDPDYEWNVWAIKRRALRVANLRNKRTKGAQTGLSHFRRACQTQTWAPKQNETQTLVEKATAMPKKVRYVGGLRGAPSEAKMHVVSLELDLGQPHEF
jgi:YHS domain-containing protein